MSWLGGLLGAGGSIFSGIMGSNAAQKAAQQMVAAANQASAFEQQMYGQTVARDQPFITAGQNALTQLQGLLGLSPTGVGTTPTSPILSMLGIGPGGATGGGINPATFQGSPGYQYQLQQGLNAVTNAAAPAGGIGGNALRALQQTGQGLANQNWSQYLGSANTAWNNLLSNIQNIVGGGESMAGTLGNVATTVGGQVGGNLIGAGNALAAGTMGSASALTGGINNAIQSIMPYLMNQQGGMGGGGGISPITTGIGNPITGIGNLLSGYTWGGMPGSTMMDTLSAQAAGNVAGGAPGL